MAPDTFRALAAVWSRSVAAAEDAYASMPAGGAGERGMSAAVLTPAALPVRSGLLAPMPPLSPAPSPSESPSE